MHISVSEGKAQFLELVRRAEAGEEVVLTRHGHPVAQVIPRGLEESDEARRARRRAAIDRFRGAAKGATGFEGVDAARSADFLYGEDGLPA